MKNRNRILTVLAIIILLALVVSMFVACDDRQDDIPSGENSGNNGSGDNQSQAHIHSFSDTLSNDEIYHWYDSTCEHNVIKDIAEHSWSDEIITKPATCTSDGIKTSTCTVCGRKKTENIRSQGHSYSQFGVITKPATCDTDGVKTYKCENCSAVKDEIIPADHSYSNFYSKDDKYHWFASTCGHDVVKYKYAHDFDAVGVCNICKYDSSNGLKYGLNTDRKSYRVLEISDREASKAVIPREFKGLPVTSIGEEAFVSCQNLESVEIPNSVLTIGERAFSGCKSLKSIEIPDSVTNIGSFAFSQCRNLESITFGDNSQLESINPYVFSNCSSLISIKIPDKVTSIGTYAFNSCASLTSIELGDNITNIGTSAFVACSNLTSIVIPNSVTKIGATVFKECDKLTIYCEAESQPSGWDSNWNFDNIPVEWGYKAIKE